MVAQRLKAGADPNRINKKGLTPVHLLAGDDQTHHNLAGPKYELYFGLLSERILPELVASGQT
jgi:hypothetical protein